MWAEMTMASREQIFFTTNRRDVRGPGALRISAHQVQTQLHRKSAPWGQVT